MPDERFFRHKARCAILSGKMPLREPECTWSGNGGGVSCSVCELPISKDQLEFEVQLAHDGDRSGLDRYHLHLPCFAAWEFERTKVSA